MGSTAVLCTVTIPPADLRSLSLYYYAVCGRMCIPFVRVWCSCQLVICLFRSRSPANKNTKQGPLKKVVKKDRNMQGVYTYKHVFNILLFLNVEVSVF